MLLPTFSAMEGLGVLWVLVTPRGDFKLSRNDKTFIAAALISAASAVPQPSLPISGVRQAEPGQSRSRSIPLRCLSHLWAIKAGHQPKCLRSVVAIDVWRHAIAEY